MRIWLVLLGSDIVMCWWFVNSLLMLSQPDEFNAFIWWPRFRGTDFSPVLPRRKVQVLGLLCALGSGFFLLLVLLPATMGLMLHHLNLKR